MKTVEAQTKQYLIIPKDITVEEHMFLELVKQQMLKKLDDRRKFIFVYHIEMGRSQKETADVLEIDPSAISKHLMEIRNILMPYKEKL